MAAFYLLGLNHHINRKMQTFISKDGTGIACDILGKGHALILVGGALSTHADHAKLAERLAPEFTIYNYDRRGRGESGDANHYTVQREVEDIDALIGEIGGSAYVYGISSGACLALEAGAALGDRILKLAIYEAPYDEALGKAEEWRTFSDELNKLLAADRRSDAVALHMQIVGLSEEDITRMKATPIWKKMEMLAHTLAYDAAVLGPDRSIPVQRITTVKAHTLVMDGGASLDPMPFMRPTADKIYRRLPNGRRLTVDGQSHHIDEKKLAPILVEFFGRSH